MPRLTPGRSSTESRACVLPSGRPMRGAASVVGDSIAWDGRRHPMRLRHAAGVWELFVPRIGPGTRLQIRVPHARWPSAPAEGRSVRDADPNGRRRRHRWSRMSTRSNSSNGATTPGWRRAVTGKTARSPVTIYEVHAQSWLRIPEEGHRSLDWSELADRLIPYACAWASRTSNSCQWRSTRSADRGGISRSRSSHRRHASASRSSSRRS